MQLLITAGLPVTDFSSLDFTDKTRISTHIGMCSRCACELPNNKMEGIVVQGEPSLSLLLCKFMVKVGIIRTITIGKHNNNKKYWYTYTLIVNYVPVYYLCSIQSY